MQTGLVGMPKHENENHPTQELKVTVDALVYVDIDQASTVIFNSYVG